MSEPVVLSADFAARVGRAVAWVEEHMEQGFLAATQPRHSVNTLLARCTSSTPSGGFYPGVVTAWSPTAGGGAGDYVDFGVVRLRVANAETLTNGVRYEAVLSGTKDFSGTVYPVLTVVNTITGGGGTLTVAETGFGGETVSPVTTISVIASSGFEIQDVGSATCSLDMLEANYTGGSSGHGRIGQGSVVWLGQKKFQTRAAFVDGFYFDTGATYRGLFIANANPGTFQFHTPYVDGTAQVIEIIGSPSGSPIVQFNVHNSSGGIWTQNYSHSYYVEANKFATRTTGGALNQGATGTIGLGATFVGGIVGAMQGASPAVPATASDAGSTGEIRFDGSHIYLCHGSNQWKRVALSTF